MRMHYGLRRVVEAPDDSRVFVYSYRSQLYYPQAPVVGGKTTVVLGDREHRHGRYEVLVVRPIAAIGWAPSPVRPAGAVVSQTRFIRRGF
jgi:hypothetical protein